jgi:flagellum-specific peptidoglycan hydrolase FlgJ
MQSAMTQWPDNSMTQSNFIHLATAAALASSAHSGLPAGVSVAQAALESAWGNSQLARVACNYFGIKHTANDTDCIELPTCEVINGERITTRARFARFASIDACFAARDHIILTASCYANAREHASDPEAFIAALAEHWATDPDYTAKLLCIYRAHHFDQLDKRT